jgi:general nucleoside transport system ATP-binding protein
MTSAFEGDRNRSPSEQDEHVKSATGPRAKLVGVGKMFQHVRALENVDLDLWPGEVHCILGENGAGKSTLMRILAGSFEPSEGHTEFFGTERRLKSRREGIAAAIGMVQQHHGLIDQLTGVENYLLGHPEGNTIVDRQLTSQLLQETAVDLDLEIHPNRLAGRMTTGERQRLEIVIALATGSDIIIFDEPTSALPSQDVDSLMAVIGKLKSRGKSIAYITHKVREVLTIGDRVTVLRRGRVVARMVGAEISESSLSRTMMGDMQVSQVSHSGEVGQVAVELMRVSISGSNFSPGLSNVSLSAGAGEIVGVAGMLGSGQIELAQLLCGLREPDAGSIRRPANVAYIPEDRATEGIAESLSIFDNAIVYGHRRPDLRAPGGRIDVMAASRFVIDLMERGDVRANGPSTLVSSLSGGNQQKLVVERELDINPQLIVANNPYRGLDVIATDAVRQKLVRARNQACSVILFSPDLEDLFELADRIVVLAEGHIVGEADPKRVTPGQLGALMGMKVENGT